jgi:D-alanyl-D-alanine carboxypeptidase/D-alanyl-D-alanine-endopeptidase (penicillin-binding protein 4)
MRRLFALALAALLTTVGVAEADAPAPSASVSPVAARPLERLTAAVEKAGAKLGLAVVDLETGARVAAHRPDAAQNPASNMKIVTAWAALALLGPGHRYLTTLHGRLDGDRVATLALRGDGDPSLGRRDLWELADALRRAGVKRVGDVAVDQSHFDDRWLPPAFGQQPNEWASFRAPVAAVSVDGNSVLVEVFPGAAGERARVAAVPATFVELAGEVETAAKDATDDARLGLVPKGDHLQATVSGHVPAGGPPMRFYRRAEDPSLLAGYALRETLEAIGIAVEGHVTAETARGDVLAEHASPPLAILLHDLGKHSSNFHAEMIWKSLSVAESAPPASFEASAKRVAELLAARGIEGAADASLVNGSGLFDANRLSANLVVGVLAQAHADPSVGPELLAQLAIAGVDGTLRGRMKPLAASRAVRAKSGTLAAVTALSGYVLGRRSFAFSILVEGPKSAALRDEIDAFVEALAKEAGL